MALPDSNTQPVAPVIDVRDLRTAFGPVTAVDGVSFSVAAGETLCIVGESGCGKSATVQSVMRLISPAAGRITGGSVRLGDRGDILALSERAMCDVRGAEIGIIFQEPMTSLNPIMRIGTQITETIRRHSGASRIAARAKALELLDTVGLSEPKKRLDQYPHELSGGMRQRVMIAMAICCEPRLIIADEPTTALDVTTQATILELLADIQKRSGAAMVFITHDLGVVQKIADRICVMYAGVVVEEGSAEAVLRRPGHPYTIGLLNSLARRTRKQPGERLPTIPGTVPSLANLPRGCRFRTRCPKAHDRCATAEPDLLEMPGHASPHLARCWLLEPLATGDNGTSLP